MITCFHQHCTDGELYPLPLYKLLQAQRVCEFPLRQPHIWRDPSKNKVVWTCWLLMQNPAPYNCTWKLFREYTVRFAFMVRLVRLKSKRMVLPFILQVHAPLPCAGTIFVTTPSNRSASWSGWKLALEKQQIVFQLGQWADPARCKTRWEPALPS